jgi:8-oxo-dGTP diphosphatase
VPVRRARRLAFDHDEMLRSALARLHERAEHALVGAELLPPRFSLAELQALQEAVLGRRLDKRNFRRRALDSGLVVPLGERQDGVAHRRAQLFRFDRRRTRHLG